MEISREEIISRYKDLFEKINDKVYSVFFDEYLPSVRGVTPDINMHPDGSVTFVTENYIEFDVHNWPCGLLDKSTGTFYSVARIFCTDSSKYAELDKAFSDFFSREKLECTHEVYIYGLGEA